MKLKLTNGYVYTIPKEILKTCKQLQIAYSDVELNSEPCYRLEKRDYIFKQNESLLKGYIYIGFEKFRDNNLNIERHWFISMMVIDRCRCRCDFG